MTTQTMDNKDKLATIKSAQNALVYDLVMQALRAARTSKVSLSVWVSKDDGGMMVNVSDKRKKSYVRFVDDIRNSDIDDLADIVEWVLDGAPEEKDEEKDDDE